MNNPSIKQLNFRLIFLVLTLNIIGVMIIRSASGGLGERVTREIAGICAGVVVMGMIAAFPYRRLCDLSVLIYLVCLALLVLVLVLGWSRGVARRWVELPVLGRVQPSEFVKVGLIIVFAELLGSRAARINDVETVAAAFAVAVLPLGLVIAEPDLSTTIIMAVTIVAMVFAAGISFRWIGGVLAVIIPAGLAFLVLLRNRMVPFIQDYQVNRILAFFNREVYSDANRQQNNSIMAIASGQLRGKGLNNDALTSVKNGNFLSEEETDFIFAVIGEELGFIGCVIVILLFALIVYECLYIAYKAPDIQGKLICSGVAVLIGFQSFTNIAVTTGIFPNTGLPLPFISYGLTSLISMYIGIGLVLSVGLRRETDNHRRFL